MNKLKIKIIVGFREDQFYTVDIEEAHNAYYLFSNPTERGVFKNGVALKGDVIQGIEPDYHSTMGWNPTHKMDGDDWNEIRGKRIDTKMRDLLSQAREVNKLENPPRNIRDLALSEVIKFLPTKNPEISEMTKVLAESKKI